jgi:hypothetical protein
MKVIFGKQQAEQIGNRMTVLELDTFFEPGLAEPISTYAVLDNTSIPLQEIPVLENFVELHNTMMLEYRKRNWKYCEDAIEHLQGKWKGELDSFYQSLSDRVTGLKEANLPDNWTGIIVSTK